ncbi:MAG: HDOD domain-containing protein [Gammaproteobacteria bacterium]|jgi:HD-like signal output (HDOD) protein
MLTIEELVHGIQDLVPLPKAYLRVQELVNDPDSSLDDVTKVIVNDTALTSRILRIANSAYMALAAQVETVNRAVQVLGLNQVHDLALAGAAVGSLTKIQSPSLHISDCWRRSVYCAVVARTICKEGKFGSPERLFVAGLLHDTGTLVLAYRQPDLYTELLAEAVASGRSLAEIQQQHLGFTYANIGLALLETWQLPEAITSPIQHHVSAIGDAPETVRRDAAILHVGAVIARAAMWRSDADEPVPEFDVAALDITGLDTDRTEEIMLHADEAVIEAMSLLLPNATNGARKSAA